MWSACQDCQALASINFTRLTKKTSQMDHNSLNMILASDTQLGPTMSGNAPAQELPQEQQMQQIPLHHESVIIDDMTKKFVQVLSILAVGYPDRVSFQCIYPGCTDPESETLEAVETHVLETHFNLCVWYVTPNPFLAGQRPCSLLMGLSLVARRTNLKAIWLAIVGWKTGRLIIFVFFGRNTLSSLLAAFDVLMITWLNSVVGPALREITTRSSTNTSAKRSQRC